MDIHQQYPEPTNGQQGESSLLLSSLNAAQKDTLLMALMSKKPEDIVFTKGGVFSKDALVDPSTALKILGVKDMKHPDKWLKQRTELDKAVNPMYPLTYVDMGGYTGYRVEDLLEYAKHNIHTNSLRLGS